MRLTHPRIHWAITNFSFSVAFVLAALCLASPAIAWQDAPADEARRTIPLDQIAGADVEAIAPPEQALSADQRDRLERARTFYEDDDQLAAITLLRELIAEPGGDTAEANFLLAMANLGLREYDDALAAAERAAGLGKHDADTYVLIGSLERRAGQLEPAIAHFRSATLLASKELNNSNVTWAWFQLGSALADAGYLAAACESYAEFDRAIWDTHTEHQNAKEIDTLLSRDPHGAFGRRLELLAQLGDNDQRLKLTESALKRWPDDAFIMQSYARTLLDVGRAPEAFDYCREHVAEPALAGAFLPLTVQAAIACGQLDDWTAKLAGAVERGEGIDEAIAVAEKLDGPNAAKAAMSLGSAILKQRPDSFAAVWAVASGQQSAGDAAAARQTLVDFIGADDHRTYIPQRELTRWMKLLAQQPPLAARAADASGRNFADDFIDGLTALSQSNTEIADEYLQAACAASPDFAPAYVVRAGEMLAKYDWEQAEAHAKNLIEKHPDLAAAHFILAEALDGLDQNDEAEQEYRRAAKLAEDEPAYPLALAQHDARLGNLLGAQRFYTEALRLDPASDEAFEGLIESYVRGGKVSLARGEIARLPKDGISEDVLRRINTSMRYIDTPYSPEHMAELRAQTREFPNDVRTAATLATGLIIPGQIDEALDVIEAARKHAPDDVELVLLEANAWSRKAEFDKTVAALEALRDRYPNRLDILASLAVNYLYAFRPEDSRDVLRRLIQLDPERAAAFRQYMLTSYIEFRDFDGALEQIDKGLADTPNDEDLIFQKLNTLLAAERVDDAYTLSKQWLDDDPTDSMRRTAFETCAQRAKQFDVLEEALRKWSDESGDPLSYIQAIVSTLVAAGRCDEALKEVDKLAAEQYSAAIAKRLLRAGTLADCKRTDEALKEYDALAAERMAGDDVRDLAERSVIELLARAGRYDEALERCKPAEDETSSARKRELLQREQQVYQLAGRDKESARILEQLLPFAQNTTGINNDLGYVWVDLGENIERATEMIRSALADDPLNAAYLDSYGWAFYKAGEYEPARTYLSRAARLRAGQDGVIFDHLGDALYRLGDTDAARDTWQHAVELIEKLDASAASVLNDRVLAAVREKLAAVDRGAAPAVAPIATEQHAEEK